MNERTPVHARWQRWRRRMGFRAFKALFETLSGVGRRFPMAHPSRHGVQVLRDLAYDSASADPRHKLDVYRPVGVREPLPVVLYVHGGGFSMLSKNTHWLMGLLFARRGYVVFNVGYRLAPEHRFPAAAKDVAQAFTWVVQHAADYGGDVGRLVLAGESAGANLVLGLTLATCYEREEPWARRVWQTQVVPVAAVLGCGILQVTQIERLWRRHPTMSAFVRDRLAGVTHNYLNSAGQAAALDFVDPLVAFERGEPPARPLPAVLSVVGTRDPLLDDTRRITRALRALGADCDARYYVGGLHAFHTFIWQRRARQCWRDIFTFLEPRVERARGRPGRESAD